MSPRTPVPIEPVVPPVLNAPEAPEPLDLLPHHLTSLTEGSGISVAVIRARGYRSVVNRTVLGPYGFGPAQCNVPGLLIPLHGADGRIVSYQYRPDLPRVLDGKAVKYETPTRARNVLDIPPPVRPALRDPEIPLHITEGAKKADAAASRGLCCLNLSGVYGWRGTDATGGKVALGDWEAVALNGRAVFVAFDSDVTTKREVRGALRRLATFLEGRGATVKIVRLPPGPDGAKVGLDDFFAAGHPPERLSTLVASLPAADGTRHPVLVNLATVEPESVSWVWFPRLARGKLHLMIGDPGEGKSTLTLDIAARLSTGGAWPDGGVAPRGTIVLLSAEDGVADTIRVRFAALGGDATALTVLTAVKDDQDQEHPFSLTRDLPALEQAIRATGAILVIIDPFSAYFGTIDTHRDAAVRGVLAPLGALAERCRVAILGIGHFNKDQQQAALYRTGASIAFIGTPRVVLGVAPDPATASLPATAQRRLLFKLKNNLAGEVPTLGYYRSGPGLSWHSGALSLTDPNEILGAHQTPQERHEAREAQIARDGVLTRATLLLEDLLRTGSKTGLQVRRAAREAGVAMATLHEIREGLGVHVLADSPYTWLPPTPRPATPPSGSPPSRRQAVRW